MTVSKPDEMAVGYIAAAERIETEIGQKPTGSVLDIGCNAGAGMLALKERWPHAQFFGIEPVEAFAHAAREKGLLVATASAEKLPHHDNAFDLVFSRHSLEHIEDRAAAIWEFYRVLASGGYLYVQAPIEVGGTKNKLHVSPFTTHVEMRNAFVGFVKVYWGPQETVAEYIGRKV